MNINNHSLIKSFSSFKSNIYSNENNNNDNDDNKYINLISEDKELEALQNDYD